MNTLIKLNNGSFIPYMGLGTWELSNAEEIVYQGLKMGYRLIDTATLYGNEMECGKGILKWLNEGNKREDVYYVTKLWNNENGYETATEAIDRCLKRVNELQYIDLLLIHSPLEGKKMRLETWKAMEDAVLTGKVKSIGVSNYGIDHIKELLSWDQLRIKPVVNEIEVSPWCMREELCKFTKSQGLEVIAFAPLSHSYRLDDPDAIQIAQTKGCSPAQVLIKWSIQKGYIPIPKTKTVSRLAENFNITNIELSPEEVKRLEHPEVHDPSDWEVTTCP